MLLDQSDTMSRDSAKFTMIELKAKLKKRGLVTTGAKTELIARLMNTDLFGDWMNEHNDSEYKKNAVRKEP